RSKGLSLFYGNHGGLDYPRMIREFSPLRVLYEAKNLPLEKYDLIINDFECITSLACKIKNLPSVNFGHQASFMSKHTPRPKKKDIAGEWILQKYATAESYIGLHFEQYDDFIYSPIIKQEILEAVPENHGHITVYLSHYSDAVVAAELKKMGNLQFELFSKTRTSITQEGNIRYIPIDGDKFNKSMINAAGIITGAGFETPAETLYLGKKLLCLPIKAQYEQLCNAAALKKFQVPVIQNLDENFADAVTNWLETPNPAKLLLKHSTAEIVAKVIETASASRKITHFQPEDNFSYAPFNFQY
ncbi:MAG: hypothetical protein RLZZ28_810, partial [Bacteroidota bacterium]